MSEWTDATRKEYKAFIENNRAVKDSIERSLLDLEQALNKAWKANRCLICPIGELAALAAATRTFYQEQKRANGVEKS